MSSKNKPPLRSTAQKVQTNPPTQKQKPASKSESPLQQQQHSKIEAKAVKIVPQKPVLNTTARLGAKISNLKSDLNQVASGGPVSQELAFNLARQKILNSPRTNLQFRRNVSRKVDFKPDEAIFSHLPSLSVEDERFSGSRSQRPLSRQTLDHDPEPRLDDFHRPYEGEEVPSISDLMSIQNLIDAINIDERKEAESSRTVQEALMPNLFLRK